MRWLRLTLWFSLGFGLLWLSTFVFPHEARADYPDGVKADWKWYVCTSFTTSGTEPYSEPECQHLPLDYSNFPDLRTESFEGSDQCGPGSCAYFVRRYVVPPKGVEWFRLSCVMSGFVDDQGFGAGAFHNNGGDRVGVHGDQVRVPNMGPGFTGLVNITNTHVITSVHGHDAGDNSHDPFYDYIDRGPQTDGYQGWFVYANASTSGTEVTATTSVNCIVDGWDTSYVPATPTPAPSATPGYPIWPTLAPFPTIIFTATHTPVPPWDVDIGYTPTVPGGTPNCYTFIPSVPVTTTSWLEFFNIPVPDYDPVGVCTEPFDIEIVVGPWDIGRYSLLLVSLGLVVGVWRMFYTGG